MINTTKRIKKKKKLVMNDATPNILKLGEKHRLTNMLFRFDIQVLGLIFKGTKVSAIVCQKISADIQYVV